MSIPIICREWQTEERPHPPERRLCAAVLMNALEDLLGTSTFHERHEKRTSQEQAFWWLFVAKEGQARLSAQFCSHVVEYDLDAIRTWLWKHHQPLIEMLKRRYEREYGGYE